MLTHDNNNNTSQQYKLQLQIWLAPGMKCGGSVSVECSDSQTMLVGVAVTVVLPSGAISTVDDRL